MKKKLFITASDKGGTGKSTFMRGVLDHARRHVAAVRRIDGQGKAVVEPLRDILALDGQPSVGHLTNYYGLKDEFGKYDESRNKSLPFAGVIGFDASTDEVGQLGQMFSWNADLVLVDMPGGQWGRVKEVYGDCASFVSVADECGYRIEVVMPLDNLKATSDGIHQIMDSWGPNVGYVVVLNEGLVNPSRSGEMVLTFYNGAEADKSGFPARRVAAAGGVEFRMPKLHQETFALFDKHEMPLTGCVSAWKHDTLHRPRVKVFRDRFDKEAARVLGIFTDQEYAEAKLRLSGLEDEADVFRLSPEQESEQEFKSEGGVL